jgi:hypothetical protein
MIDHLMGWLLMKLLSWFKIAAQIATAGGGWVENLDQVER